MEIHLHPLQKLLQLANDIGVTKDQIKRFIEFAYIPLPWQLEFHAAARRADNQDGPVDVGLGGARGPGKSHCVLSQAALDDCQRVKGLKGLFLRQTGIAAKESFDDLVEKVLVGHLPFQRSGSLLRFPNSSRIVLGGFQDEKDIDKYIGIEYDFMIVEELNQLTEDKYTKLRGSLRTSKPNWRPRMYTSFNPGGIGHVFVRNRYIVPFRENTQKETLFVGATYKQNPFLNKEYIEYLEGLKGALGRAWREGEWELFEGRVFHEFRYNIHTIKPLKPKTSFPHYLWIDWGYSENSAFAAYITAEKEEQIEGVKFTRAITFKEFYGNLKTPDKWATEIYDFCTINKITIYKGYTDPSMHSPEQSGAMDIAHQMMNKWKELHKSNWVLLEKGQNSGPASRVNRIGLLHNWLSTAPDGLPYWIITQNCVNLIRTLPDLIYDENKVDEWDTTQEDHAADAVTYGFSKLKFVDAIKGIGGIKKRKPFFAFDKEGKSIGIDLTKFAQPEKKTDWRSGV